MAQPWGVSAMETTNEAHKTHGSALHRIGESLKNSLTPESSAETKARNHHLEEEHTVAQGERNAAFAPNHHVGGTNLSVEQGLRHEGGKHEGSGHGHGHEHRHEHKHDHEHKHGHEHGGK